jgi:acyl-coenzyme A thioesterase PaaI-like protein
VLIYIEENTMAMNFKTELKSLTDTAKMRLWALLKVPMILYIGPSIKVLDEDTCVVKVPLKRKTKNHLGSMYFGVMCTAADIAGGLIAMNSIQESGRNVSLVFKDFKAEFLKRAQADCYFTNTQGKEIRKFVQEVIDSGERMTMPVDIIATVPGESSDEVVAKFTLGLSLKLKE